MQYHLLAGNVAHLQVAQFIAAPRGGVERRHNRPMLQVGGPIEDARDLVRTDHRGQPGSRLGGGNLIVKPRLFENSDGREI
jgi:hypothetical protein